MYVDVDLVQFLLILCVFFVVSCKMWFSQKMFFEYVTPISGSVFFPWLHHYFHPPLNQLVVSWWFGAFSGLGLRIGVPLCNNPNNQITNPNNQITPPKANMSNEKSGYPGCLGYARDDILPNYIRIIS